VVPCRDAIKRAAVSVRVEVAVLLDDETLAALDWWNDAPPGMQVARRDLPGVVQGMLECSLGELLLKHRDALRKAGT